MDRIMGRLTELAAERIRQEIQRIVKGIVFKFAAVLFASALFIVGLFYIVGSMADLLSTSPPPYSPG